jgi:hypothetical protein
MTDANTGAPKFAPYQGLGVSANGSVLFDNVTAGAFHSNVALGVFGVDASEKSNTQGEGPKMTHAGWVARKVGTGPVASIAITAPGKGYTNGFLTITGGGTGNNAANASYAVQANGSVDSIAISTPGAGYSNGFLTITGGGTGNSAANASYTVNAAGNIVSVIINNGGSNYDSVPTVQALGSNTATASLLATCNTGSIVSVTLVTPGDSYVSTVSVTVANGNSQATFAATMGGRANRKEYITLVAAGSMLSDNVANTDDATVGA